MEINMINKHGQFISNKNDPELKEMANELEEILNCKCGVCEFCKMDDETEEIDKVWGRQT